MNTKFIAVIWIVSLIFLASCSNDPVDSTIQTGEDMVDTTVDAGQDMIDEMGDVIMPNDEEGVMIGGAMMVPSLDIVDNAVNSDDHTTLVAAVQAANLVEALKGEGPFTVFAPTNDAFDALPEGTVETLLMPENVGDLTSILTYHVVPGMYTSADLAEGLELTTLQGDTISFSYDGTTWMVNGADIEIADAISSNGVTHSIGSVLLPSVGDEMDEDTMNEDA